MVVNAIALVFVSLLSVAGLWLSMRSRIAEVEARQSWIIATASS